MTSPHSADAEQSLVARLLIDPDQIGVVAGELEPEDFHVQEYAEQYRTMLSLTEQGKSIDIVSLGEATGEPVDVLELTTGHHAPLSEYIAIIKRKAYQRKMIQMGRDLIFAADEGDISKTIEAAAKAADLAITAPYDNSLGIINLADYRDPPPNPLLGVISPEGTTVLYGDGGDGKGWVAARWASQLPGRVAILDFEHHPTEWAYRLDRFGVTNALYVAPPTTLEKWATERAVRLMRTEKIDFLVIDSAMYASNVEDPYSPASALAYKRARAKLGNLPCILLAHTAGSVDKVFGSVFWRNEARIVWRLAKDAKRQRFLECRKANNYSELEGKRFTIEFDERLGVLNLHEHGTAWAPEPVGETVVAEW
jgi:hypothetical protein